MALERSQVFDQIKNVVGDFVTTFQHENLSEDTEIDSLDLDSLDRLELVIHLEEVFDFETTDDAYEKWETIKDVVDFYSENGS